MASEIRKKTRPLRDRTLEELKANPFRFDFFRAVRLLENRFRLQAPIGSGLSPDRESIRFGQRPDLSFESSTLQDLEERGGGRVPRLNVRFFGLFGSNGPMPLHITDFAHDRARNHRDKTLASFLNIFHHRLISFFYRAWAINQKSVDYDRPESARFVGYIGSFFGLGDPTTRGRDAIKDRGKLFYAGRLAEQARHSEGLEAILSDYFEVPVEVQPMVGHWLPLPMRYQCRLGVDRESATLGESAVIGENVWDVQTRIRLLVGPLKFSRFCDFLPSGRSFRRLKHWILFYTTGQFHWDVQLVLKAAEVPATQLGGGTLLGWTSWLKSGPIKSDAADLILDQSETRSEREQHMI